MWPFNDDKQHRTFLASHECFDTLEDLAVKTMSTHEDVLARAVAMYDMLVHETIAGSRVVLRRGDEPDREVIVQR